MIRYLIVSLATITLMFSTSGCTSKTVDAEPDATSEMTDDGSMADAAPEGGEAVAEGGDAAAEPEAGSSDFSEDDFGSDDAVADSGTPTDDAAAATTDEGFDDATTDGSVAETPPADGATDNLNAGTDSADSMGTADPGTNPEATTETAMNDSSTSLGGDEMGGLSEEPPAPPKASVPLKKIQTTPWTQGGILLNAVYLARANDTFKSVSQKIYGSDDKASELRKGNPSIAARKMKVGDKVYYNSPKRPTDDQQMLTFYEDLGLSPEVYVAVAGDNVKDVSKKLLGDSNSWKEIWATNLDVESKGELTEGTRLRYWAGDLVAQAPAEGAPVPDMAGNVAPPPAEAAPQMPEEAPAAPPAMAEVAPQPMNDVPPPPPVMAEAPPVPAEVPQQMGENPEASANPLAAILGEGGDQTTALMIGAILLIAAVALFIIIRKRKARRNIDFQTATHTHID